MINEDDKIGLYDKTTHQTIKKKNIRYKKYYQVFTEENMGMTILKRVGANTKTLVWEYLLSNMDYENEIQPCISDISYTIDASRSRISNALTHFEKELLIFEISGSRKGRLGRKFMINPNYVNRGKSENMPKKIKRWDRLIKEHFGIEEW